MKVSLKIPALGSEREFASTPEEVADWLAGLIKGGVLVGGCIKVGLRNGEVWHVKVEG